MSEIRSHLGECAGQGQAALAAAITGLGAPHDLARRYLEEYQLAGAVGHAAPGRLMLAMLGRARQSALSLATVFAAVLLYVMAVTFLAMAVVKPLAPGHVGAWSTPWGLQVGITTDPPAGAVDLVGYWIMPFALLLAVACYIAGTRLLRAMGWRLLSRTMRIA